MKNKVFMVTFHLASGDTFVYRVSAIDDIVARQQAEEKHNSLIASSKVWQKNKQYVSLAIEFATVEYVCTLD